MSLSMWIKAPQQSPHRVATAVLPHLRAAIGSHLVDILPGNGTVQQSDISSGGTDSSGPNSTRRNVGVIASTQNGAIRSMRREGLAVAERPIIHVGYQNKARIRGEALR